MHYVWFCAPANDFWRLTACTHHTVVHWSCVVAIHKCNARSSACPLHSLIRLGGLASLALPGHLPPGLELELVLARGPAPCRAGGSVSGGLANGLGPSRVSRRPVAVGAELPLSQRAARASGDQVDPLTHSFTLHVQTVQSELYIYTQRGSNEDREAKERRTKHLGWKRRISYHRSGRLNWGLVARRPGT